VADDLHVRSLNHKMSLDSSLSSVILTDAGDTIDPCYWVTF